MELRDPRHTGRPVSFGLAAGADTDTLFITIAGAAADLLAQEAKAAKLDPTRSATRNTIRR